MRSADVGSHFHNRKRSFSDESRFLIKDFVDFCDEILKMFLVSRPRASQAWHLPSSRARLRVERAPIKLPSMIRLPCRTIPTSAATSRLSTCLRPSRPCSFFCQRTLVLCDNPRCRPLQVELRTIPRWSIVAPLEIMSDSATSCKEPSLIAKFLFLHTAKQLRVRRSTKSQSPMMHTLSYVKYARASVASLRMKRKLGLPGPL